MCGGNGHGECDRGQKLPVRCPCRSVVQASSGEKREYILTKQLLRSGTSIGANVVEAQQAQSRADFISKLSIALKEAVETDYWLRLLKEADDLTETEFSSIYSDCKELEKLLTSIIKTTRLD